MYERKGRALLSWSAFFRRLLIHLAIGLALACGALSVGMMGYRIFAGVSWSEAFVHAATPLAGMGVTHVPNHTAGQFFTGVYAIVSSFVFLLISAVIYTPIVHRLLHAFHLDDEE